MKFSAKTLFTAVFALALSSCASSDHSEGDGHAHDDETTVETVVNNASETIDNAANAVTELGEELGEAADDWSGNSLSDDEINDIFKN